MSAELFQAAVSDGAVQTVAGGGLSISGLLWWLFRKERDAAMSRIEAVCEKADAVKSSVGKEVDEINKKIADVNLEIARHKLESERGISTVKIELSEHKAYAEGNFAKIAALNESLNRVHSRIDDVANTTKDIYQLLVTTRNNA